MGARTLVLGIASLSAERGDWLCELAQVWLIRHVIAEGDAA